MDTVVLAPAGYLLDPDIGSDYERPWRLAEGLAKRGLRVVLVAREVKRLADLGPNVEPSWPPGDLPTTPVARLLDRANLYWHARRVAYKEVASGRAFVIHHSGPCGEQSPSLITKLPVPFVYGPLPPPRPANIRGDEWLSWLRTPDATNVQHRLSKAAFGQSRAVARFLWRKTIRRANAVTVEARANSPTARPDAIVIPPGIDIEQFSPDDRSDQVPGRVIAVGNLLGRKSYDLLLQAIALTKRTFKPTHVVLVGSGPEERSLIQLAQDLGIGSSVVFAGQIPRASLPELLRSAAVFCHPASFDTFPLAPLEAMACGLPTIVSSAGALPEIVGDAGLVHSVGDERELAHHLIDLFGSPAARQRLGDAARTRVVEHFTWQAMCDSYLDLYQRLAQAKARASAEPVS